MPAPYTNSLTPLLNAPEQWLSAWPRFHGDINKYTRGHVLVAGGAIMTGAARLAARAAQRMGAGLVTLAAASAVVPIYAVALESVIVRAADDRTAWEDLLHDSKKNLVLIGPGLGVGATQRGFVEAALRSRKRCVLDADALNNFADTPDELFALLHEDCVLTPHEGEFARLFHRHINPDLDKPARALRAASLTGATLLLKGAETYIADAAGRIIHNNNAPSWLATAGAGDVLSGMIAGLLAQAMPVMEATAAAAWIHGEAAQCFGIGLIAEDLIDEIPPILQDLLEIGR